MFFHSTVGIIKVGQKCNITQDTANKMHRGQEKNPLHFLPLLAWTQWLSFAYVSQKGVDFSKTIDKMKIIFWFDFHRCSHGLSKIGHHFRKQSNSKIEVFKKWQLQKTFFSTDTLQWKKNKKDSKDVEKWLWKSDFLTTHVNICESQIKKIFFFYWFFC